MLIDINTGFFYGALIALALMVYDLDRRLKKLERINTKNGPNTKTF